MNFNIPTYLFDFKNSDDGRTRCKLKMFYIGETADGRVFDKEFADYLITSLPYTPVVAFYSELQDDFIGHNMTQYIYGIVTPESDYGFEVDEDGVEWFITDVMLYTDRIDNIGEIAKKVVGKPHSLEMDPSSVEYEIFKENGKRKIRFKKARLAGLSVLGDDQKPAFTGSEFFAENDDLKEKFETFFSLLHDRGALMEKQEIVTQYVNFIKLTYNEKQRMVGEYVQEQYGADKMTWIAEMDDSYVVVEVFDWDSYTSAFKMFDYSIDEQGVSLSNERACFRRFLSIDQIESLESKVAFVEDEEKDEKEDVEDIKEDKDEEKDFVEEEKEEDKKEEEDFVEEKDENEDEKKEECISEVKDEEKESDPEKEEEDTKCVERVVEETNAFTEGVEVNEPKEEVNFQTEENQEDNTTSASKLTDSEREELEAYRFQAKLNLIGTYKDDLPAETISSFEVMAKECSYNELESKLAIEYRTFSKNNKVNNATVFSFVNVPTKQENVVSSYAELVKKALNK